MRGVAVTQLDASHCGSSHCHGLAGGSAAERLMELAVVYFAYEQAVAVG